MSNLKKMYFIVIIQYFLLFTFSKMRERGLSPHQSIFISLFNACANSPFKDAGLTKAEELYLYMKEKDIDISLNCGEHLKSCFVFNDTQKKIVFKRN